MCLIKTLETAEATKNRKDFVLYYFSLSNSNIGYPGQGESYAFNL